MVYSNSCSCSKLRSSDQMIPCSPALRPECLVAVSNPACNIACSIETQYVSLLLNSQVHVCPRPSSDRKFILRVYQANACISCNSWIVLWLDAGTIMQAPAHGGVTGYLEPLVFAAALAALPCAAERNAVYILRCLRHCITGAATAPQGDTLLAACWQTVQQGALAPLVATVTSENDTQTPLVLLMAATCQQSLLLMKRSTLPPPPAPRRAWHFLFRSSCAHHLAAVWTAPIQPACTCVGTARTQLPARGGVMS